MHDLDLTDINVMNSPYFYLQPNDYISNPQTKNMGCRKIGISFGTITTLFSVATTIFFFLFKKLNRDQKMLDIKDFSIF
jgi:polysaccharide export outer membrane protein